MRRYLAALMMLLIGVLGGCASGDQDPRTGGLLGGLSGIGSGAYENRVKEKEARLEQLRATQSKLDAEKGQLDQQQSAAKAQLTKDQAEVSAMQSEIADLEQSSRTLTAQHDADRQRVAELQRRITDLKGNMHKQASALDALEGSGLGDADVDLRRKQLEKQRDDMAREYELLMKMQVELVQ